MSTSKKSGASQPAGADSQKNLGESNPKTPGQQSQQSVGGVSDGQAKKSAAASNGQATPPHGAPSHKEAPPANPSDGEDDDMFNQNGNNAGSIKSKQTAPLMMTGVDASTHKASNPNLSNNISGKTLPTGNNAATPMGGGGLGTSSIPQKPRVDLVPNVYALFDFIFPGGKLAKLAKIENLKLTSDQLLAITRAFKFSEGAPVIVMAGARNSGKGKFLAGLARAAFRSDAIILDSGVETGIENYCIRRNVKLVGVFPEGQVTMPKINPTQKYPNQLANGHTHLFMLTGKQLAWGSEARIKFELAKVFAKGDRDGARLNPVTGVLKPINRDPPCKIVYIVLGDADVNEWIEDVRICPRSKIKVGFGIKPVLASLLQEGHFYALESGKSEDLAAFAHFFLTVTPYGQHKRDWQKDLGGSTAKHVDEKPAAKQPEPKPASTPKSGDNKSQAGDDKSAKKSKAPEEPIPSDGKSAKSNTNKK